MDIGKLCPSSLACATMAAWVLAGPMDGPAFVTYIKTQLAPTLQMGDVVVLDNLPAHKVAATQAAIKERGAWL